MSEYSENKNQQRSSSIIWRRANERQNSFTVRISPNFNIDHGFLMSKKLLDIKSFKMLGESTMTYNLRVLLVDVLALINVFPLMDLSFFNEPLFPGKCWKHHFCAFNPQLVCIDIDQGPVVVHPRNNPGRRQWKALTTALLQSCVLHLWNHSRYISVFCQLT